MFIKLNKPFIDMVRKDMKNNPKNEIGYILRSNNTYTRIKGTKYNVNFNKIINDGIVMHTHPPEVMPYTHNKNDPPSDDDYFTSYKVDKYNDDVVFDKSGIWLYRPNNYLSQIDYKKINKKLDKQIRKMMTHYKAEILYFNNDINRYIRHMNKLIYIKSDNKYIGFKVKYYPYSEIKKNDIIKLKYF